MEYWSIPVESLDFDGPCGICQSFRKGRGPIGPDYIASHPILGALKGRDFLTLRDYSPEEIQALIVLASTLKRLQREGTPHRLLAGKSLAMLFYKSSTRTRISFEVGINQLGGHAVVVHASELQLGRGETIEDTARVFSRFVDGVMIRAYAHSDVESFAQYADIPVINGLTDSYHPCQVLADLQTIWERFGTLRGLRFTYIGDGNNMAHSLAIGCVKMGMETVICTPPEFAPDPDVVEYVEELSATTGGRLELAHDPMAAAKGAHVLYTDVWVSMGQESERQQRMQAFAGFQLNRDVLEAAHADAIVLHCLPAHRGEEISADVMDGDQSLVFDQAENRLHAQKALMAALMR